jgi:colanic acid/amylovoran biosynthesis glycosyltransferase
MLAGRPRAYLGALAGMIRAALGSPWFLFGGLAIFPKVVHQARRMEAAGVRHVHCHFANHPATAGYVISRLTRIPFSFTAHGSDLHRNRHMLREKVTQAHLVVTISRYNRERILEVTDPGDARKVRVIHCGVDPARFRPREADSHDATGVRRLELLCVASFQEVKGHEYLLRAVAGLRDRGIRFRLRLIGDGPRRKLLEGVVREHGLGEDVELLGARPTHEVAAAVRETDVFVLPSVLTRKGDREGIPVALMEAMAAGVPVVASRLSGIPELVRDGETGLLVEPRDVDGLTDAIARLHGDPALRARLARAGREVVQREFDLHLNAAELAALLTGAFVPAATPR